MIDGRVVDCLDRDKCGRSRGRAVDGRHGHVDYSDRRGGIVAGIDEADRLDRGDVIGGTGHAAEVDVNTAERDGHRNAGRQCADEQVVTRELVLKDDGGARQLRHVRRQNDLGGARDRQRGGILGEQGTPIDAGLGGVEIDADSGADGNLAKTVLERLNAAAEGVVRSEHSVIEQL